MARKSVIFDLGMVLIQWDPALAFADVFDTREAAEAFARDKGGTVQGFDELTPDEVLFVVDAMIGQDAMNTAQAFLDGDAQNIGKADSVDLPRLYG